MAISPNRSSWVAKSKKEQAADGTIFWGPADLTVVPRSDDQVYVVRHTDSLSSIAAKFYGDPRLWWVIAIANRAHNPTTLLYAGRQLIIPAPMYVQMSLVK